MPTTINNTETFGAIPFIINLGASAYLEAGKANNGNGGNEPTGRDRIIENINREKN